MVAESGKIASPSSRAMVTVVGLPTSVVEELEVDKRYRFRVRAKNARGENEYSAPSRQVRCPTSVEFIIISQKRKKAKREARAKEK